MYEIREEIPTDVETVREVNDAAFGGNAEGRLVDKLRSDGLVVTSLVALSGARIVGNIVFSDVAVTSPHAPISAATLAPLSVAPGYQHCGIGSALVRRGLEQCRERGKGLVVVLGHPSYYPRFGFSAELARRINGRYSGDAWMALELAAGALGDGVAEIVFPEAFDLVG